LSFVGKPKSYTIEYLANEVDENSEEDSEEDSEENFEEEVNPQDKKSLESK